MPAYWEAITSLKLQDITFGSPGTIFFSDMSTRQPHPIILESWGHIVFRIVRNLSHFPSTLHTNLLQSNCLAQA